MCGQKLKHTHQSKYTEVTKFNRKSSRKIKKKKKKKRIDWIELTHIFMGRKVAATSGLSLEFSSSHGEN